MPVDAKKDYFEDVTCAIKFERSKVCKEKPNGKKKSMPRSNYFIGQGCGNKKISSMQKSSKSYKKHYNWIDRDLDRELCNSW